MSRQIFLKAYHILEPVSLLAQSLSAVFLNMARYSKRSIFHQGVMTCRPEIVAIDASPTLIRDNALYLTMINVYSGGIMVSTISLEKIHEEERTKT